LLSEKDAGALQDIMTDHKLNAIVNCLNSFAILIISIAIIIIGFKHRSFKKQLERQLQAIVEITKVIDTHHRVDE